MARKHIVKDKLSLITRFKRYSFAYLFILPTVLAMVFLHLAPILQGFYMSFLKLNQITLGQYLGAPFVGLNNYAMILLDPNSPLRIGLIDSVRNTVLYTVFVTMGTLGLGMLVSLMVDRKFRGQGLVRTLFLFPWIVPTYVTGLLWGFMWQRGVGIINIILYDILRLDVINRHINVVIRFLHIDMLLNGFNALIMFCSNLFNQIVTSLSPTAGLIFVVALIGVLCGIYMYLDRRVSPKWGAIFACLAGILFCFVVFKLQIPPQLGETYKPFWLVGPNTLWAIIFPTVWRYWPFSMLMLLAGLQTIPQELYEAADIDGASPWRKFWMITWPLLKPVWGILILFGLIYNVYSFNIVIMMFGFGAGFPGEWGDLMMTNIFRNSFMQYNFGAGAAASIILLVVMVIIVNIWMRFNKTSEEYR